MPSAEYTSNDLALLAGNQTTHPRELAAVKLTLTDGSSLRLATAPITAGGDFFNDGLLGVTGLKMRQTAPADRCTVAILDVSGAWGRQVFINNLLDNAFCEVFRIYVYPDGTVVRRSRFFGLVLDPREQAEQITLTVVNPASAARAAIGGTPNGSNCWKIYKSAACSYTGSISDCDKTLEGGNGCKTHFSDAIARRQYGGTMLYLDRNALSQLNKDGGTGGTVVGGGGIGVGGLKRKLDPIDDSQIGSNYGA